MKDRPKLKLQLSPADKLFEILGCISILVIWVFTLTNYSDLPDTIPTHYNENGEADGFGGKVNIFILPSVATVIFTGLSILNMFPHVFNYPSNLNADNALAQYTSATRLVRYLKVNIVIVFGLIAFKTVRNANGQSDILGV